MLWHELTVIINCAPSWSVKWGDSMNDNYLLHFLNNFLNIVSRIFAPFQHIKTIRAISSSTVLTSSTPSFIHVSNSVHLIDDYTGNSSSSLKSSFRQALRRTLRTLQWFAAAHKGSVDMWSFFMRALQRVLLKRISTKAWAAVTNKRTVSGSHSTVPRILQSKQR